MPVPFAQDPTVNPDTFNTWSSQQPALDPEAGYQAITDDSELSPRLMRFGSHLVRNFQATVGLAQGNEPDLLDTDDANARYGVPGYLRFNQPVLEGDAADMAHAAHATAWRDYALSHTQLNPLRAFGAGLDGAIVDPLGLPLMLAGGELVSGGKALFAGGEGAEAAGEAGMAFSRLGRVGNAALGLGSTLAEGAVSNVPYVAADYGLRQADGQNDYKVTNALTDIAAGAILHTSLHYGGEGLRAALKATRGLGARGVPDTLPDVAAPEAEQHMDEFVPHVPDPVSELPPFDRMGAFRMAADSMAADEPVRVGELVERSREPPTLNALDERSAQPQIPSFRPGDDDTAVTPRGTEIPVQYGLAELGDLTTSHDDALNVNPAYPSELQPRDRGRLGAQARNFQLENELNPKLLMTDTAAGGGAPIVSPTGVVESGNGRTIALRRSAAKGGEAYARYKAELEARGYDTSNMKAPVLVRARTEPMTGAQRSALAREMNADTVERMSPTEQAMNDARQMDAGVMAHAADRTPEGQRNFAKAFIAKVAGDSQNALADATGRLSKAGEDRISAALVAKAYGEPRLVSALFETADDNIKAIGNALRAAAPDWAAMRDAFERGAAPRELDVTPALNSAVDLVRYARDGKIPLRELIEERLGQSEMFGGEAISPETEAFLRLFFRDERFTQPLGAAKLSDALSWYARQAEATVPGPNLFGEVPDVDTARQILANLAGQFARGDAGGLDLRAPGRAAEPGRERGGADPSGDGSARPEGQEPAPRPAVVDVPARGEPGDGGPGHLSQDAGGEPGGKGDNPGAAPGETGGAAGVEQPAAASIIAADPELKDLAREISALAAETGEEPPADPKTDPNNLAKAVEALQTCALGAAEEFL